MNNVYSELDRLLSWTMIRRENLVPDALGLDILNPALVSHITGNVGYQLEQSIEQIKRVVEDQSLSFITWMKGRGYGNRQARFIIGYFGLVTQYQQGTLLDRASRLSAGAHAVDDQRRKYSNLPYIVHPREVASVVSKYTQNEDVIAAAWLHDVLEDTTLSDYKLLRILNSPEVLILVMQVTDISTPADGNRAQRKAFARKHYGSATQEGKLLKLSDLLVNLRGLTDLKTHNPSFARTYLDEATQLLPVIEQGEPTLGDEIRLIITQAINQQNTITGDSDGHGNRRRVSVA